MFPVKKEFPYTRFGSFRNENPYTIAFIYPQVSEPYIVKGGYQNVREEYDRICQPAIVHETKWYHGSHRTTIRLFNLPSNIEIFERSKNCTFFSACNKHIKWAIVNKKTSFIHPLRRLPRKWIQELDQFTWGWPIPKNPVAPLEEKIAYRRIELEEEEI